MVTLTYRPGVEWSPDHVKLCLQHLRKWAQRAGLGGLRYVWVAEMQARGAVHYHAVVWLPPGMHLPKLDAVGYWPHGLTQREKARSGVAYLMKYLSKGSDGVAYPRGIRTHGCGGLSRDGRDVLGWHRLPAFLRPALAYAERGSVAPAVGGGWSTRDGAAWWPSEFKAFVGRVAGRVRVSAARLFRHQVVDPFTAAVIRGPWSRLPEFVGPPRPELAGLAGLARWA